MTVGAIAGTLDNDRKVLEDNNPTTRPSRVRDKGISRVELSDLLVVYQEDHRSF